MLKIFIVVLLVGIVGVTWGRHIDSDNQLALQDDSGKWSWGPQSCGQPPETGHCRAAHPRFHFDPVSRTCLPFIWGGCGGNTNRFLSVQECVTACGAQG